MGQLKNMFFSRIENLTIENYHGTKKLTVSQKISLTWSVSLHVIKNVTKPLIFESVLNVNNIGFMRHVVLGSLLITYNIYHTFF